MFYCGQSNALATDTGTAVSNAATGSLVEAGEFMLLRIWVQNRKQTPISVRVYDGAANAVNRRYIKTIYVPYFAAADLNEISAEYQPVYPTKILNGLYLLCSDADGAYAVVDKAVILED